MQRAAVSVRSFVVIKGDHATFLLDEIRKLHKLLEQGGRTRVTSAQEATLVRVGLLE